MFCPNCGFGLEPDSKFCGKCGTNLLDVTTVGGAVAAQATPAASPPLAVLPVTDPAFGRYGRVVEEFDYTELLATLRDVSAMPAEGVLYSPSERALERLPVAKQIRDNLYGGMPVQVGYTNGSNRVLNCLEYHRGSELNVADDDVILLLAPLQKMVDWTLDTGEVEAFRLEAGQAVLLYETTLHYAPCNDRGTDAYRVVCVLPRGTNGEMPVVNLSSQEDMLLWGCNKWLLAHPDSPEAELGAYEGLTGANLTV